MVVKLRTPQKTLNRLLAACVFAAYAGTVGAWQAAEQQDSPPHFKFYNYDHNQGIAQNQILDIVQDNQGYIWLATRSGLLRYDGHEFTHYTIADGLSANSIETLALDAKGRLLVGTWGGGICMQRKPGFVCVTDKQGLRSGIVHDFALYNNAILVATETGLASLQPDTLSVSNIDLPFESAAGATNWVLAVAVSGDNTLWIGTHHGLLKRTAQGVNPVDDTPFGNAAVTALFADKNSVYAGTGKGVYRLLDESWQKMELPAALQGTTINQILDDDRGRLWIITDDGALQRLQIDSQQDSEIASRLLTKADGLPSNQLHAMLQSRDGTFWFATDNGLSKLIFTPFLAYGTAEGLPQKFVRSLYEQTDGDVWIGTKAGVAVFRHGRIYPLKLPAPFDAKKIYAIHSAPEGGMLIGTSKGLLHWQNGNTTVFDETDGLPAAYVSSMAARPAGGIWLGTRSGLAYWLNGKIHTVQEPLLNRNFILALAVDSKNRLWVASDHGGVVLYHNGVGRLIGKEEGLSDFTAWTLEATPDGAVWVGTNGDGAYRISASAGNQTISHLSRKNGLADNFVWQILHDSEGRVWFYTNNGLDRLANGEISHFDRSHGLPSLEGNTGASLEHQSGLLFFGTTNGLVIYNPAQHQATHASVNVIIESVTSPVDSHLNTQSILPYNFQQITIDYTGLVFSGASSVNYRYRLHGLSDNWINTNQTTTTFGSLFPGQYVFEVTARVNEGAWADPARFAFTIAAPFWLTWWFWVLSAVLLILVFTGLYRLRIKSLKRTQRLLQQKVRKRTRELEVSNRKLQRLSFTDELTQLYNRRHFMDELETELHRMERAPDNTWLSLLFIDLDHFKKINDNFGHIAGDHVLVECGQRLNAVIRNTDILARHGGEEFAIMLPFTGPEGAQQVAIKILHTFSDNNFHCDDKTLSLTASIGIAMVQKQSDYRGTNPDVETLFKNADNALYQSKSKGRNRFSIAEPLFSNTAHNQQRLRAE